MAKSEVRKTKEVAYLQIHVEGAINRIKFFYNLKRNNTSQKDTACRWHDINLCCIAQFEAKIYKNQRKGLAEVTGNLHLN